MLVDIYRITVTVTEACVILSPSLIIVSISFSLYRPGSWDGCAALFTSQASLHRGAVVGYVKLVEKADVETIYV